LQRHNLKLRAIAAAVVESDVGGDDRRDPQPRELPAPSTSRSAGSRTDVLRGLMRAAITDAHADYGNIQLREPVHGGLTIKCTADSTATSSTSSDMSMTRGRPVEPHSRRPGKSWSTM
jgi:hypothetical protein